jgi:hypothetical protein
MSTCNPIQITKLYQVPVYNIAVLARLRQKLDASSKTIEAMRHPDIAWSSFAIVRPQTHLMQSSWGRNGWRARDQKLKLLQLLNS